MSKIKIGDKIAFRHEYSVSDDAYIGTVKSIKNSIFWKEYLVEDESENYYLIDSSQYHIILIEKFDKENDK